MSRRVGAPLIRHTEDWRAIATLNAYRGLIGFGLVTLLLFAQAGHLFDVVMPDVFRSACLAYLALWVLSLVAALTRTPPLRAQVLFAVAVDVVFFTTLVLAGTGVAGGLGMLLIAPLSAAGMLLPARLAFLLAACAAIGVLGQEALRPLQIEGARSAFVQAGILGVLFFLSVGLSHWLARRAREGEALAAERAGEVQDLAALNRHIIQHMEIGAIVVDADRRIRLINDAAVRLLDLTETAPQNASLTRVAPAVDEALSHWLQTSAGGIDTLQASGRALLPLFSRLGTARDALVLISLEDALRQSEQAQQLKLVSLGRLTSSIAHEIRNPLGAISHAGQLLAETATLDADGRRLLDIVHRHTRRIDDIIDSILGLSRRSETTRRTIALADWLASCVNDYREYNARAPDFEIVGIDAALCIEFDPGHLRQVLFNLWDNAQRHARRDETALRVRLRGHHSRSGLFGLDVADNGPGLGADISDRVMEPFFTTAREGTGLGLHIARELCEANRARLAPVAESDGACFRIVFAQAWAGAGEPATSSIHDARA